MSQPRKKILFHENAPWVGGSTVCLSKLLGCLSLDKYEPLVVLAYSDKDIESWLFSGIKTKKVKNRFYNEIIGNSHLNRLLNRLNKKFDIVYRLLLIATSAVFSVAALCYIIKKNKIQIVHANNGLGSNISTIFAASFCRVPCICHVRIIESFNLLQRITRKKVSHFIAISEVVQRNMVLNDISPEVISTIYDGLTDSDLAHEYLPEKLRREYCIADEALLCGMVGMLTRWKGCDVFLTALGSVIKDYPAMIAVVVGDTITAEDLGYKNELLQLVKELGLENNVIFTGFRSDTYDVFSSLDIVVHASVTPEPFGMVLLEAMAASRPVVASKAGGPLEIIEDGVNGLLFEPGDSRQLAHCISRLVQDRQLRMQLGVNARKTVTHKHRMQLTVANIEKIYAEFED